MDIRVRIATRKFSSGALRHAAAAANRSTWWRMFFMGGNHV
jgi:hypothetical protein